MPKTYPQPRLDAPVGRSVTTIVPSVSFRRLFPYVATLVVVGGLGLVFALRPTPFIGLTPEAVASSLDGKLGAVESECEEVGDSEWTCTRTDPERGAGYGTSFDLEINGFGCWSASPRNGTPTVGVPTEVTGCVTVWDH